MHGAGTKVTRLRTKQSLKLPKINMKSIPKDMGATDFDIHF